MKERYFLLITMVVFIISNNCSKPRGIITDIDGNEYNTIKIGHQWWTTENLKVTHYRNGDTIPEVRNDSVWCDLVTGAYCSYDNNEGNSKVYGYLYNWYAVSDSRNIAIQGWHVPSREEWITLYKYLLKKKKSSAFDKNGFSAIPSAFRREDGVFDRFKYNAQFWTSSDKGLKDGHAWPFKLYFFTTPESDILDIYHKNCGQPVRLVRDGTN